MIIGRNVRHNGVQDEECCYILQRCADARVLRYTLCQHRLNCERLEVMITVAPQWRNGEIVLANIAAVGAILGLVVRL